MRIAIDLRSLMESGGKISGVENYTTSVINEYKNSSKEQTGARLFGFYNSYNPVEFPIASTPQFPILKTSIPNKILNSSLTFLDQPKFEALYSDFDTLWMPDVRPYAIQPETKLAITVHDLSPVMHPEFYSLKRRLWHRVLHYKKTFERANLIFAVSEYTKYDIIKLFGISPEKIKVVYPGIDHQMFRTDLDERLKHKVRVKYNLPEKYILSISTVEPRKNILNLVSAFEALADPHVFLVIAGRLGWLYQDILKRITASPKKDHIHLLGYIPETDKPYLISQSLVVCYPSYYEGFGFVPLEAFACGVPAITSARTSMPEVCGDAALLIEPYQVPDLVMALKNILNDMDLRAELIRKGLARAQLFGWHKTATMIFDNLIHL